MSKQPTILIAGGGDLHIRLLDPFPPTVCSVTRTQKFAEVLNLAAEASLILIDAQLTGGGVELCRRLRADPITAELPLVLLVKNRNDHLQALSDARVMLDDFPGLIRAVRDLLPPLSSAAGNVPPATADLPEEHDEQHLDNPLTPAMPRGSGVASSKSASWPPSPPVRGENDDLLGFAQVFSGYLDFLLDALGQAATLSGAERQRLRAMTVLAIESTDQHLSAAQAGITAALVGKDIERMKALSAAKNSLYDKLQQLRGLLAKLPGDEAPAPNIPADPVGLAESASAPKKSELTRAAEAKRAAEIAAKKIAHRPTPPERPSRAASDAASSSARRRRLLPWLTGVALIVAAALAVHRFTSRPRTAPTVARYGEVPVGRGAKIEQTRGSIIARPESDPAQRGPAVYMFRWLVNGKVVEGENTARLPAKYYRNGDTVQAELRLSHGGQLGKPMLSPALVVSAPPVARPLSPSTDAGRR